MHFESWKDLYVSDLQSVWLLAIAPLAFLVAVALGWRRGVAGRIPAQASFVRRWCVVFAMLALVDAFSTTLGVRALGWSESRLGVGTMIVFVLLGDWRVFVIGLGLATPGTRRLREVAAPAAACTIFVPLVTLAVAGGLRFLRGSVETVEIWLIYELAFFVVAVGAVTAFVPARVDADPPERAAFLIELFAVVATYYALWALADVLIHFAGLDAGWALRVLPNQIYYGLFVPFVWMRFFDARSAARSGSARAVE